MRLTYKLKEAAGDRIAHTGFNGWVNFDTKGLHFCARCDHINWLTDGMYGGELDGVTGNPYDDYSQGGAKVSFSGPDLYDMYFWAAVKFGWYQFIDETPNEYTPTFKFVGPEHDGAKEFAALFGSKFRFKSDHKWPRNTVTISAHQIVVDRQALLDLVAGVDCGIRHDRLPAAMDALREPFFEDEISSGNARKDFSLNTYK